MNGEQIKLYNVINELISSGKEGQYWDFKEQWPDDKMDIIKDIICMANNLNDQKGYIIFGIKDPNPRTGNKADVIGVESGPNSFKQTSDITDQLSKMPFAGGRKPSVKFDTIEYNQKLLNIITVESCDAGPIYLDKKYSLRQGDQEIGKKKRKNRDLYPGTLYVRDQDSTTPWDETANPEITEMLWKKHFHMLKTPMENFLDLLEDPSNWEYIDSHEESPALFRCKLNPNYRMEICNPSPEENEKCITVEELRNCMIPPISSEKVIERIEAVLRVHERHEFYAYTQPDPSMGFSELRIEKDLQLLKECSIVNMDGYRALIPLPALSSLDLPEQGSLGWIYYIKGSLEERLLTFMNQTLIQEWQKEVYQRLAPVLLLFDSETEKEEFTMWCEAHKKEVREKFEQEQESNKLLVHALPYPDVKDHRIKTDINNIYFSATLKRMLEDFRRQVKGSSLAEQLM